jgi:hypothetical protein
LRSNPPSRRLISALRVTLRSAGTLP